MLQPININDSTNSKLKYKKINLCTDKNRRRSSETSAQTKFVSAITAAGGAAFAVSMLARKQNKGFFDVNYSLKEMLGVAFSAVSGGVLGGVFTSKPKTHERKLDEGIFQYSMIAVPGLAVSGAMLLCDEFKRLNNTPAKLAATGIAVAGGWQAAVKIANFVSDIDDDEPDRKLKFKDAIASVDDLIGIMVLAKVKFVKKMRLERILPAVYAFCGYKAGTTN